VHDILIIGGGINGVGIARDAAGRGYDVCLAEMNDLASGTSSWSSKLVHGGLRYLEHYEFKLVRESLIERERLWAIAPHIIEPLRFVLPHHKGLRPEWVLRAGLLLYDNIGGRRKLPPTRSLKLDRDVSGKPLKPRFRAGFEYSDCRVDDTRLVVLNARDAANRGADIRTRTRVVSATPAEEGWRVLLQHTATGLEEEVTARMLINAAGPWAADVLGGVVSDTAEASIRLVQGSHIVVRKLYDHDRCYTFQEDDGRIIFVIPYQKDFTLIGTTDRDYDGDPAEVAITDEETDYLIEAVGDYFENPPTRDDIVWSYSGVRPLYDDGASKAQEATRDYVLKTTGSESAPTLNIFGGKLTTYRRLAEAAMERIERVIGRQGSPWTGDAPLPGGDFPTDGRRTLATRILGEHPYVPFDTIERLVAQFGTDAWNILEGSSEIADLGHDFGAGLSEREVAWLMDREWAETADDVLWRRTKLGLRMDDAQAAALETWMRERRAGG